MELANRVAVVTGGTAGIGKAIARRFVEEGAKVAIIGRSDHEGRQIEADLKKLGEGDCAYFHADVGSSDEVRATISAIIHKWAAIHVLVNNAAVMMTGAAGRHGRGRLGADDGRQHARPVPAGQVRASRHA